MSKFWYLPKKKNANSIDFLYEYFTVPFPNLYFFSGMHGLYVESFKLYKMLLFFLLKLFYCKAWSNNILPINL